MTTVREVLTADLSKNYAGRDIELDSYVNDFVAYAERGGQFFAKGRVMIMFEDCGDGVVEFHCMNGGNGSDLTDSVNEFLDGMSKLFDVAVTYYDTPRVNDMMKYVKCKYNVEKIDDGVDRTFMAQFFLKEQ